MLFPLSGPKVLLFEVAVYEFTLSLPNKQECSLLEIKVIRLFVLRFVKIILGGFKCQWRKPMDS